MAIKQKGSLSPKEEADLKAEAAKESKISGVKKFDYLGQGRYNIVFDKNIPAGQNFDFLDIVNITSKNGVISIKSAQLKKTDIQQLAALDIKIDGKLEVSVPSNSQILSQNASSTPTLGFGNYSWKIGSLDQQPPTMKVKIDHKSKKD